MFSMFEWGAGAFMRFYLRLLLFLYIPTSTQKRLGVQSQSRWCYYCCYRATVCTAEPHCELCWPINSDLVMEHSQLPRRTLGRGVPCGVWCVWTKRALLPKHCMFTSFNSLFHYFTIKILLTKRQIRELK